jgi:spore coat polysaccharide biosynthesis predicted glycosyltransferase SpsG
VDRYDLEKSDIDELKERGLAILVLDDRGRVSPECDLLLNQNLGAEKLRYCLPPRAKALQGIRYALLRPPFRRRTTKVVSSEARNVLVTFGGSDRLNLAARVIEALAPMRVSGIRVVLGPSCREVAGHDVRVIRGASAGEMRTLMDWADVAITAPGSTCWELAFVGVPMILIAYDENQRSAGVALQRAGAAHLLGWESRVSASRVRRSVASLAEDVGERRRMSRAGRRLVDGHGVERVMKELGRCGH